MMNTITRQSLGSNILRIGRFERLERSAAVERLERARSIAHVARHTAAAAEATFEQTLRMESMATRAVAGCLGTMVTAASLATALEHPDTLISDKWCFWTKGA